jgi:hypothetical protein
MRTSPLMPCAAPITATSTEFFVEVIYTSGALTHR